MSARPIDISVLLLESDSAAVAWVRRCLDASIVPAFRVTVADRLMAAIVRLASESFDVVLCQPNLADSTGIETIVRVLAAANGVPVVVLADAEGERVGSEALALGVQDLLVKGACDGELVVRTLRYAIERERLAEGLRAAHHGLKAKITERTVALSDSEELFRAVVDSANEGILVYDESLRVTACNEAAERIIGIPRSELIGSPGFTSRLPCVHEDGTPLTDASRPTRMTIEGGKPLSNQVIGIVRPDASIRWLSVNTGFLRRSAGPRHSGIVSTISDITTQRNSEVAVEASAAQLRALVEAISRHASLQSLMAAFGLRALQSTDLDSLVEQAVTVVREGLRVTYCRVLEVGSDGCSRTLTAGSGWDAHWIGKAWPGTVPETQNAYVLTHGGPVVVLDFAAEARFNPSRMLAAHGIRSGVDVAIPGVRGPYGLIGAYSREMVAFGPEAGSFLQSVANIVGAAIERRRSEERLLYLAQYDSLTDLPNRNFFSDRLGEMLGRAPHDGRAVGLLLIDIDSFKDVNDTYGHETGDALLKLLALRLRECLGEGDALGRVGGDKFGIAFSGRDGAGEAGVRSKGVATALAAPFDLAGQATYVTASIGISIQSDEGGCAAGLLRNASVALYRAKHHGHGHFEYYLPQMNEAALARLKVKSQLHGALERGEFLLHFQPKVNVSSGAVSGLEALLRWQHPERGLVPPSEFIDVLEETGLIVPVGEWIMRTVCEQIGRWRADGIDAPCVSVNLSASQLQDGLDKTIASILAESGVRAGLLELELTESMLMRDPAGAARTLERIKSLGVRLSVDDFGTGYSSLAYLQRFPLDALKIDRTFISDFSASRGDATLALAIINLGHSLNLQVVAEGVETAEQLGFLRANHCDEAQGFYLARPQPVAECTRALLAGWRLPEGDTGLRVA